MKDIKTFILESNSKLDQFKEFVLKYGCTLQGPDSTGIAYLVKGTEEDEFPSICLELNYNSSTFNFYDANDGDEAYIIIQTDEENSTEVNRNSVKLTKSGKEYVMNDNNAKLLCDLLK